jgi:hypothetical protein
MHTMSYSLPQTALQSGSWNGTIQCPQTPSCGIHLRFPRSRTNVRNPTHPNMAPVGLRNDVVVDDYRRAFTGRDPVVAVLDIEEPRRVLTCTIPRAVLAPLWLVPEQVHARAAGGVKLVRVLTLSLLGALGTFDGPRGLFLLTLRTHRRELSARGIQLRLCDAQLGAGVAVLDRLGGVAYNEEDGGEDEQPEEPEGGAGPVGLREMPT